MAACGCSRNRLLRSNVSQPQHNAADRPQNQCPCGLRQNEAQRSFEERPNRVLAASRSSAS